MAKRTRPQKTADFINQAKNPAEDRMTHLIDLAAEFENFQALLPELKKDLKKGLTSKQLREKYAPLLQAQQISAALTNEDTAKGADIAQKVLDRAEGKAVERKEVKHQFSELSDEELDALLISELQDVEEDTVSEH